MRSHQRLCCIVFLFLLCFLACGLAETTEEAVVSDCRRSARAYGEMVAQCTGASGMQGGLLPRGGEEAVVLFRTNGPLDLSEAGFEVHQIIYGPYGFATLLCTDGEAALVWLSTQPGVSYVELDTSVRGSSVGADEQVNFYSYGAQLMGVNEYIRFVETWGSGSASVAVIDSGVFRHSLIAPRIHAVGYDYVDRDSDPTNDMNGHGTRVAGIVADSTQGLNVSIYPIRVLDANADGKLSHVIAGVLEAVEAGVDVINLSLSTEVESGLLQDAIRQGVNRGIIVVVAAGNDGMDAAYVTPGCMTDAGVIVVGCADADGKCSSFSNYGSSVDVYAYGRNISCCGRGGGFVNDSGTSMAAPHISALCAMLRLIHPGLSPSGAERRIVAAASEGQRIPSASAMVPQEMGFNLNTVRLRPGETLQLPCGALPATACETIRYTVQDEQVVAIQDGRLTANTVGQTTVTADCAGFNPLTFTVEVGKMSAGVLALPSGTEEIGEEAFLGLEIGEVILPDGLLRIGARAFDGGSIRLIRVPDSVTTFEDNDFSGAVVLCSVQSPVGTYLRENNVSYIIGQ